MKIPEFHAWIKSGKRLVVLDNLVLDLGRFAMIHPGGKFALDRTVGRDLSKFFYGGFHILSQLGSHPPHAHSMKALEIAK
jgi:cytochrome b involved in lipid metabolism